jgi:hypothetical protein
MKAGVDSPENLLSYQDFDGDFKTDGEDDQRVKTWSPHIADWQPGDPVWQGNKGIRVRLRPRCLIPRGIGVLACPG